MSDSPENDKKHLLGDLESIKHLLDQEDDPVANVQSDGIPTLDPSSEAVSDPSPLDASDADAAQNHRSSNEHTTATKHSTDKEQTTANEIPLLDEVVKSTSSSETDQDSNQAPTIQHNEAPQGNPFIPYEAIDRLKKERKNMRNFAVEVMEAAQQGVNKKELDQFDLFQYAKQGQQDAPPSSTASYSDAQNRKPNSIISLPDEAQMNALIDKVIEDHRPMLEEALKDALTDFIKQSLSSGPSKD